MNRLIRLLFFFFFQAEDGIRDYKVTGVQTCALPISWTSPRSWLSTAGTFRRVAGYGSTCSSVFTEARFQRSPHPRQRRMGLDGADTSPEPKQRPGGEIGKAAGRGRGENSGGARSFKK